MSLGTKALIGLIAGLGAGLAIAAAGRPQLAPVGTAAEVVGTMWINAILMTILPLVVSKLMVSIAGHDDGRALGRAGWRAGALFLGLLTVTAILAAAVMPAVFAHLPIDHEASASLRASVHAAEAPTSTLSASQWLVAFVPSNAIRAAADGAIVPVLLFTVAFALAASRIPRTLRDPLVDAVPGRRRGHLGAPALDRRAGAVRGLCPGPRARDARRGRHRHAPSRTTSSCRRW